MNCSNEFLQTFLDSELGPAEADAVRRHLDHCTACRQELSRLRLLWLELEQDEEIEMPMELAFIRQQAISQTRAARQEAQKKSTNSLWDAQRLAWQPALAGMSQIPGPRQLARLARATGGRLPDIMRGISSVLGTVARRRRD